jgi:hypothetical protein
VDIEIKEAFKAGEEVTFNYTIISDSEQEITFISFFDCPNAIVPLLDQKTIQLKPNVPFQGTSSAMYIAESVEPQDCIARIEIIKPFYQNTEKKFRIETKPSFEFRVLPYEDESCTKVKTVFIKGERVYFNYDSEVPEPEVKGKLTAPDGKVQEFVLPADVVLDQTGEYILETEAEKEGYKTNKQSLEIIVLAEEPKFIDKRICNANGICEPERGENYQNCPQDCLSPEAKEVLEKINAEKQKRRNLYCLLGSLVALLIIGFSVYYWLRQKRRKDKSVLGKDI